MTLMLDERTCAVLKKMDGTISMLVKQMLAKALKDNIAPSKSKGKNKKVNIRFKKDDLHLIGQYKPREISQLVMGAVAKHACGKVGDTSEFDMDQLMLKNGRQWRSAQTTLIPHMVQTILKNNIGTYEASTGSGKGMSLVAAALGCQKKSVIASPSIKIMRQLIQEMTFIDSPKTYSVILGQQAFVSQTLLLKHMEDLDDAAQKEIKGWVGHVDSLFGLAWLVADLIHCCTSVPDGWAEQCSLTNLNDKTITDEGVSAWRASLKSAKTDADIVFCTHAMLAVDILCRKRELKNKSVDENQESLFYQAIADANAVDKFAIINNKNAQIGAETTGIMGHRAMFIDEAHMLQESIASMFCSSLSLYALLTLIKKSKNVPDALRKKLRQSFNTLVKQCRDADVEHNMVVSQNSSYMVLMAGFAKHARAAVAVMKKAGDKDLKDASDYVSMLDRAISDKGSQSVVYISLSPSYKYPRILHGKKNLLSEMAILWGSCNGAVLASATMRVPGRGYKYVSSKLNIPSNRASEGLSIESPWLHENIVLHYPRSAKEGLMRPSGDSDADTIDHWYQEVAHMIDRIAANAKGGTLVLATSYDIAGTVRNLVSSETYKRIILQGHGGKTFEQNEAAFRSANRPVWVAVGRAWTGLDLHSKENPELLTDLVIINLPFGMQHSASHVHDVRRNGFHNVVPYSTSIMLKQGIGRLKREDDETQRNIWVLDNRMFHGKKKNASHFAIPRSVLMPYEMRSFKVD